MKRRDFLNITIGAAAFTPLVSKANTQYTTFIDSPPDLTPTPVGEAGKWFMNGPTRIGWFTLRYSDAQQSAAKFVQEAADAKMNLICVTFGGSFAFYPSHNPHHQWAPGIAIQNDFIGELVTEAKRKNIRVGARFDFSKQSAKSVAAHPEWFFTNADGSHPVDASGRTPPCINGDFFRKQAVLIMNEVIERYRPALIYLNNFGNNLGGQNLPDPCQCANCKELFSKMAGKTLPRKMTDEVRVFLKHCTYSTGKLFFESAQRLSPETIFINADTTPTHGWHSETRMVLSPSQVWLYITSEAVNRQHTSYPGSVTCNNVTSYSSNASRLVLMPAQETRIRLFQAMAHGSPPTYVATGTMKQDDMRNVEAAREVFLWHARNEDVFGNTINPAKVLLLVQPEGAPRGRNLVTQQSMRGIYRILAENHVPVVVSESTASITTQRDRFDVVIVSPGADTKGMEEYVRNGGKVLYVNDEPAFAIPARIRQHDLAKVSYLEVRDTTKFPSLKGIKYLMATSMCPYIIKDIFSEAEVKSMRFIEYPPEEGAGITFVPPTIENPAEVSQSDLEQTNVPGLVKRKHGKGRLTYLPWDVGALYDRFGLPAHAQLLMDVFDDLLVNGRQLTTDAHSSVEMVLAWQEKTSRLMLHMINLSGQTQNNYMDSVPMNAIKVSLAGNFSSASTREGKTKLDVLHKDGRAEFTVPGLGEYEVVVLER